MPQYNKEKALKRKIIKATKFRLPKQQPDVQNKNELLGESQSPDNKLSTTIPKSDTENEANFSAFKSFSSLEGIISEGTMRAIKELNYETMTEVQERVLPRLLQDRKPNCIVTSKTGSGKTLAFLTIAIEMLKKIGYKPMHGTGAIIICPTREVAMQTYGILIELIRHHTQTIGLIMGGENRKVEADKLIKGINLLVATSGRLLDHLKNTPLFYHNKVCCLIIDEADRMLDFGYGEEIQEIDKILTSNEKRKKLYMFMSATKNAKTIDFARHLMKSKYVHYNVGQDEVEPTVSKLEQAYLLVKTEERLRVLITFLKNYQNKKIMVFFNSVNVVHFYEKLLNSSDINPNFLDNPILGIHGKKNQVVRAQIFLRFSRAQSGVLLCTDLAARGWDIPAVDWIVQYDPPGNPNEYIQRVGRTARAGKSGYGLLLLTETELGLLSVLKEKKVVIHRATAREDPGEELQELIERIVAQELYFSIHAKEAFKSYLRSYKAQELKHIFNFDKLDLRKVIKCFGLAKIPYVNPEEKPDSQKTENESLDEEQTHIEFED